MTINNGDMTDSEIQSYMFKRNSMDLAAVMITITGVITVTWWLLFIAMVLTIINTKFHPINWDKVKYSVKDIEIVPEIRTVEGELV